MAVILHVAGSVAKFERFVRRYPIITLAVIVALVLCVIFIHHDFNAFLALGPGGTPSTFKGYLRIKFLSLFALSNPYLPAEVPPTLNPQSGHLKYLPPRFGPRPTTKGIAPHRQLDQLPTPASFNALSRAMHNLAEEHPSLLRLGTSCLERHGPGLFAISAPPEAKSRTGARHCSAEICHSHPSEGSTHLNLHPADAAVLLQAGWGERHPLAQGGWLSRFVPSGFVLVYAPRTEEEVEVIMTVIKAAVWWVAGVDVDAASSGKAHNPSGTETNGTDLKRAACHHCGR